MNSCMADQKRPYQAGFSLLETVIAVMVMGAMFAALLALVRPLTLEIPIQETEHRIGAIEDAIESYLLQNGILPCPASFTALPSTPGFGEAVDCSPSSSVAGVVRTDTGRNGGAGQQYVRVGAVPVKDLDLSGDYMVDGWDMRFTYAVTEKLTQPNLYSNNDGGIYITDPAGNDMTAEAGTALYTVISHGKDRKGAYNMEGFAHHKLCNTAELDVENCDNDAIFVSTRRSYGTQYYDDLMQYKSYMGNLEPTTCGNKGLIFAPGHPEATAEGCLDPGYKRRAFIKLVGDYEINCTAVNNFCNSAQIDVGTFEPGDYLIHWNAYLRFKYPQPSQYAVLEFEADDIIQESPKIPFQGSVCQAEGELQSEGGLMRFNIDNESTMRVRMKFYGGDNDPVGNGCGGFTPSLGLIEAGEGSNVDARKTLSFDPYRKPQTF
jgi:type II secretory pathway pseudopilin PulG